MFGLGGNWLWRPGWIFIVVFMGMIFASAIPLTANRKLLEERLKSPYQEEQAVSDKIILTSFLIFYLAWLVIMPLDSQRFNWSPEFPIWLSWVGVVGFIIADVLLYYVFRQNAYLYTVVKKLEDQQVVSTGLYGVVRHPMYMAIILSAFSGAFILGSLFGVYIAIIMALILYIRTLFEERLLVEELAGYKEYKEKVKYRFIPYVL
jgi:protein-S-isoprenylcysteine O-methyltransferase Ste14